MNRIFSTQINWESISKPSELEPSVIQCAHGHKHTVLSYYSSHKKPKILKYISCNVAEYHSGRENKGCLGKWERHEYKLNSTKTQRVRISWLK
jgi:hypothetical protein